MTFNSFFLILLRQFQNKWGRFFLASGGIIVGVWALMMTTGLSLGLSNTVITAINSQPFVKEFQLYKTTTGQTSFFDFQEPPVFKVPSIAEVRELKAGDSRIEVLAPSMLMQSFVGISGYDCNASNQKLIASFESQFPDSVQFGPDIDVNKEVVVLTQDEQNTLSDEISTQCLNAPIVFNNFNSFYENNTSNWYGENRAPNSDEIVMCYRCGNNFSQLYDVSSPEQMVGKKIKIQALAAPRLDSISSEISVTEQGGIDLSLNPPLERELTIIAVVDDRESSFGVAPIFVNEQLFYDAFTQINSSFDVNTFGSQEYSGRVKDFSELEPTLKALNDKGYLTISPGLILIDSLVVVFAILQLVLAGFGLIALIASVFGIIAVMIISVLERKTEIGILKAMGAKDIAIFFMFVLESVIIGFLGWLIGILLSLLSGLLVTQAFKFAIELNPDWQKNLTNFNITDFSPTFPWWLYLITLAIAVVFTVLAGVFPSIVAARQNPSTVLRGE